jgi:hypothetical protein
MPWEFCTKQNIIILELVETKEKCCFSLFAMERIFFYNYVMSKYIHVILKCSLFSWNIVNVRYILKLINVKKYLPAIVVEMKILR